MKTEAYKCDGPGCTKIKQTINHWFVATFYQDEDFYVSGWIEQKASVKDAKHACGEACLLKIISEHIKKGE